MAPSNNIAVVCSLALLAFSLHGCGDSKRTPTGSGPDGKQRTASLEGVSQGAPACVDDDAKIIKLAASLGKSISSCRFGANACDGDIGQYFAKYFPNTKAESIMRATCCATCKAFDKAKACGENDAIANEPSTGEGVCEGHCWTKEKCLSFGSPEFGFCCQFDEDEGHCYSNIGKRKCEMAVTKNFANAQQPVASSFLTVFSVAFMVGGVVTLAIVKVVNGRRNRSCATIPLLA